MRPPAYNTEEVQQIPQEQGERNVAMAVCVQLAGRAIIRVVSRCEEAQDNCNLGMLQKKKKRKKHAKVIIANDNRRDKKHTYLRYCHN